MPQGEGNEPKRIEEYGKKKKWMEWEETCEVTAETKGAESRFNGKLAMSISHDPTHTHQHTQVIDNAADNAACISQIRATLLLFL